MEAKVGATGRNQEMEFAHGDSILIRSANEEGIAASRTLPAFRAGTSYLGSSLGGTLVVGVAEKVLRVWGKYVKQGIRGSAPTESP